MVKEEKGFESKIKSMYSGKGCSCSVGIIEKRKSTLRKVRCINCGKVFKTNRNTDLCVDCEMKVKKIK